MLDQETLKELVHYDPETGIFTYRERSPRWFKTIGHCKAWNKRFAGKRPGYIWTHTLTGYQRRNFGLLGKEYLEHQMAWLYMKGHPIPKEIDHINRNATDNRWRNLRPVTHAVNGRNISMKRNNTSGITGVCLCKKSMKWRAYCKLNGKQHSLGYHLDILQAKKAVREFLEENGFSAGHGLEKPHYKRDDNE